jgi:hypothetical protein
MTTTNPLRQEYENQSAFAMRSCCQHRKQGLTPAKPSQGLTPAKPSRPDPCEALEA